MHMNMKSISKYELTIKYKKYTEELSVQASDPKQWRVFKRIDVQSSSNNLSSLIANTTSASSKSLYSFQSSLYIDTSTSSTTTAAATPTAPRSSRYSYGSSQTPTKKRDTQLPIYIKSDGSTKLHELCKCINPSVEMIKIYASTYPWSLKQRDGNGDIPLHCALKYDREPNQMVISILLFYCPESAAIPCLENHILPLFLAVSRQKVSSGVLKALLAAYPAAATTKSYGSYALHLLVQQCQLSSEAVKVLVSYNPNAVKMHNSHGNLPLHFQCSSDKPNIDISYTLLHQHPDSLNAVNHAGQTPIHRALCASNSMDSNGNSEGAAVLREHARALLKIHSAVYTSAEQKQILRDLNWDARRNIVMVCASVASKEYDYREKSMVHLYAACHGVMREIVSYL